VNARLQDVKVPGVSIAVVNKECTYSSGYGLAVLPDTKATPHTLYYTGSTTKSFTAAAIMMLIADSTNTSTPLKLETRISSLIDFVVPDDYVTVHATLEDALTHRTGMPRHEASYGGPNFTLQDTVYRLRYLPMTAEIRQKSQYCNMMFAVLTAIIEKISGKWLGTFFRDRIWGPLEMKETFLSLQDAKRAQTERGLNLAKGYYFENTTGKYHEEMYMQTAPLSGAGAIISTVNDFAKYLRAMITEHPILSKESYKQLRTPRAILASEAVAPFSPPLLYALAWTVGNYRDTQIIHHSGSVLGFGSYMAFVPGRKWGVVVMANSDTNSNVLTEELTFEVLDRLFGTPASGERMDWVKKHDNALRQRREVIEKARERLYPNAPPKGSKAITSPGLRLDQYVGTYWHPGYGEVRMETGTPNGGSEKVLFADVANKTLPHRLVFEHVNGEHFISYFQPLTKYMSNIVENAVPAEFRIGSDSNVVEMGIRYEALMKDEKIWFKRRV
jgi:CubicO group peptidase (beta-lactamase class C family)